jgi:hypothetical protein
MVITIDVNLNVRNLDEEFKKDILDKLIHISNQLNSIETKEDKIMIDLTALEAEVTEQSTVIDSTITLLNGLSTKLTEISAEVKNNPIAQAKITELTTALDSRTKALADAVAANTPGEVTTN